MDTNIPTQPVQNESPAQQQSLLSKKSNFKKMFWIFFIVSILIAFVAGGFFIGAKQNKFLVQNPHKLITPTVTQSTSIQTPTPYPTVEPGKPINANTWTIFKDSATSLSFKYPPAWKMTEGPKSANTATYDYEYLKLSGKEGSIVFTKANQLGGSCDNYRNISINGSIANICQFKRSGTEDESWSQLYVRPLVHISDPTSDPRDFAFDINVTIHQPLAQNRDIILQILNTIAGVKIPAD